MTPSEAIDSYHTKARAAKKSWDDYFQGRPQTFYSGENETVWPDETWRQYYRRMK